MSNLSKKTKFCPKCHSPSINITEKAGVPFTYLLITIFFGLVFLLFFIPVLISFFYNSFSLIPSIHRLPLIFSCLFFVLFFPNLIRLIITCKRGYEKRQCKNCGKIKIVIKPKQIPKRRVGQSNGSWESP